MPSVFNDQNRWEYEEAPTLITWAETHVVLAIASAAIAWFAVVYVLALVVSFVA